MDRVLVSRSELVLCSEADNQWLSSCDLASFRDDLPYVRKGFKCPIQSVQVCSPRPRHGYMLIISNGASPAALWLGHILFELPAIILVSTIITIIFAVASSQFNFPGMVWICFVLYGVSSTLYAYLFTLGLKSPLASWALVAGFNVILFLLYLSVPSQVIEGDEC